MFRLRSPLYAQIELTYACNLGCSHCYNEPRFTSNNGNVQLVRLKKEKTGKDRFLEIAEELARNDVFSVTLTGGEALAVRDRLYPSIETLRRHNLDVSVNSNLTLLTKDDAKRMRDLEVSGVLTSLISYDPETHDEVVNLRGSHKKTLRGIEILQKYGVPVVANTVASQNNKDQVYETGLFVYRLGMNSFQSAHAIPSNSGGKLHLEHSLALNDLEDHLEDLHRIREETGMFVRLTIPVPYCSIWESKPHLRYLVETSTCTAGRSIIQIDPSGNVKACPMVNNKYGNILEGGLESVWERMSEWDEDRYIPNSCKECDLVTICRSGCRAEAERVSGSLDDKHPFSVKPVKVESKDYNPKLPIGTRLSKERGIKVREEGSGLFTLYSRDRYLVTTEGTARFISAIPDEITVDETLFNDPELSDVVYSAYNSGMLTKIN